MRQITISYTARAVFFGRRNGHRNYERVSIASLARLWRAINRRHESFAMVRSDDYRAVYGFCEVSE